MAENALNGRTIVEAGFPIKAPEDKGCFVLTLDDGSTLTITEGGGPGADANWYTYPEITLQKDGKELDCWRL